MPDAAPGARLVEFAEVMAKLRAECDWKRAQTHRSLVRYLIEESQETIEAIDSGDAEHLCEELGDLLLQVYFHAVIAEEAGEFTIDDVAAGIIAKMKRRNPHVYGDAADAVDGTPGSVIDLWERMKAQEKQRTSVTDGLPPGLPALLFADKVLDRLARSGVAQALSVEPAVGQAAGPPGTEEPAGTELDGELGGESAAAAIGERLLAVVADARTAGVDPEQALRDAVRRRL